MRTVYETYNSQKFETIKDAIQHICKLNNDVTLVDKYISDIFLVKEYNIFSPEEILEEVFGEKNDYANKLIEKIIETKRKFLLAIEYNKSSMLLEYKSKINTFIKQIGKEIIDKESKGSYKIINRYWNVAYTCPKCYSMLDESFRHQYHDGYYDIHLKCTNCGFKTSKINSKYLDQSIRELRSIIIKEHILQTNQKEDNNKNA
jgi:hypothetical protein